MPMQVRQKGSRHLSKPKQRASTSAARRSVPLSWSMWPSRLQRLIFSWADALARMCTPFALSAGFYARIAIESFHIQRQLLLFPLQPLVLFVRFSQLGPPVSCEPLRVHLPETKAKQHVPADAVPFRTCAWITRSGCVCPHAHSPSEWRYYARMRAMRATHRVLSACMLTNRWRTHLLWRRPFATSLVRRRSACGSSCMNACMRRIRCLRRLQAYRPNRSHLADMASVGCAQHTDPYVVRGAFERAKVAVTCDVLLVTPELDGTSFPTRPHTPDTWPVAELPDQLHVP